MRVLILLFVSFALCACTSWPKEGRGGAAEYHATTPKKQTFTRKDIQQIDSVIKKVDEDIDVLVNKGARACYPGQINNIEVAHARAKREFVGGFYHSAQTDLYSVRTDIERFKREFYKRINSYECKKIVTKKYRSGV